MARFVLKLLPYNVSSVFLFLGPAPNVYPQTSYLWEMNIVLRHDFLNNMSGSAYPSAAAVNGVFSKLEYATVPLDTTARNKAPPLIRSIVLWCVI